MKYINLLRELSSELQISFTYLYDRDSFDKNKFIKHNNRGKKIETIPAYHYILEKNEIVSIIMIGCALYEIPKQIFQFSTLKSLILVDCSLKNIDKRINQLQSLQWIDLSFNDITQVPISFFELEKLEYLDLMKNSIADFSVNFVKLKNLQGLNLSFNKITHIPQEIIAMDKLWDAVDLLSKVREEKYTVVKKQKYENAAKLRDIEIELEDSGKTGIDLFGNDVENLPPELATKGKTKILEYWKSLEGTDSLPVNEFKLIFVGEGGAGKTSLLKRVTSNDFDEKEKQTHGINIKTWTFEYEKTTITANLWDFGGQEIMHSTHQFFLSNRSLYVVVIDSRRDQKVEYWLKHIEALGSSSPTIIVINKIDENPGFDINRKFLFDKYPNIISINRVSCSSCEGLESFVAAIYSSISSINHIHTLWPKTWFSLKQKLANKNENFISIDEFFKMCEDADIYTKSSQEALLSFLHDLGLMLHFKDFELNNTNVLNPHWVTEGVYKIVTSKALAKDLGIISFESLKNILDEKKYPQNMYLFLISLMEKFELCYRVNPKEILIPDLLNVQEPEITFNHSLEFIIEYNFLPRSIFPKFIVRMKNDVKENFAWRTGVILDNPKFKTQAKVIIDHEEKILKIFISGKNCREYFSVLHHTISDINSSFSNLVISERIPINSNISVSYYHLKNLEEMGEFNFIPEGLTTPINVSEILGTVTKSRKELIETEILEALRNINKKIDDEGSLIKEANRILDLKPNIAGIGININAIIDKLIQR